MSVSLTLDMLAHYRAPIFIETGTFEGGGVEVALDYGFPLIISIELDNAYYHKAFNNIIRYVELKTMKCKATYRTFTDDPTVIDAENGQTILLYEGDSVEVLPKILEKLSSKITFWLDAHAGNTPTVPTVMVPLLLELEQISKHSRKDHNILIDDKRLMGTSFWSEVTEQKVIDALYDINGNYGIEYIDTAHGKGDIMAASVV